MGFSLSIKLNLKFVLQTMEKNFFYRTICQNVGILSGYGNTAGNGPTEEHCEYRRKMFCVGVRVSSIERIRCGNGLSK